LAEKDTIKLSHGLKYQDFDAYNLVFCNLKYHYAKDLEEEIRAFEYQAGAKGKHRIRKLLVKSYFEGARMHASSDRIFEDLTVLKGYNKLCAQPLFIVRRLRGGS